MGKAVLTSTHNLCFEQIQMYMKNIRIFLSENFLLVVKFLMYLNRHVFVMIYPVSILCKSISGRHRPVRVADGPMTA